MLQIFLKLSYLIAITLSAYTAGWLLRHARKNRAALQLAFCQLLVIPWCVPQLFSGFWTSAGTKLFAYCISYLGICLIGPAWVHFAALYCRSRVPHAALAMASLYAVGALFYASLLTNGGHRLFYRSFELERVVYGPLFYANMAYVYVCVGGGMAALAGRFRKEHSVPKHWEMLILAAAVPLCLNFLYMNGVLRIGVDLTAPAFSVSGLFLLLAVFRYDLLDVNPQAMERIFEEIAEGVVIVNSRNIVTYCNAAACRLFDVREGGAANAVLEPFSESVRGGQGVPEAGGAAENDGAADAVPGRLPESVGDGQAAPVLADRNGTRLELRRYETRGADGRLLSQTVLITDVSRYFALMDRERELAESRQRLLLEQERNRIAQDVHDTTGHTLTMIGSLLRLMEAEWKKTFAGTGAYSVSGSGAEDDSVRGMSENSEFEAYLQQARGLASDGLRELRCSINALRRAGEETVTQVVRGLAAGVHEIAVEVQVQGEDGPAYSHLSPVVFGCLREAITNCLRYAEAAHMDVILRFLPEELALYIFDDGKGCETLSEGNGLRGIRERAERAGGSVRVVSAPGEGFQIVMRLPVYTGPEKQT